MRIRHLSNLRRNERESAHRTIILKGKRKNKGDILRQSDVTSHTLSDKFFERFQINQQFKARKVLKGKARQSNKNERHFHGTNSQTRKHALCWCFLLLTACSSCLGKSQFIGQRRTTKLLKEESGLGTKVYWAFNMADHYEICCTQRIVLYETKAVSCNLKK